MNPFGVIFAKVLLTRSGCYLYGKVGINIWVLSVFFLFMLIFILLNTPISLLFKRCSCDTGVPKGDVVALSTSGEVAFESLL